MTTTGEGSKPEPADVAVDLDETDAAIAAERNAAMARLANMTPASEDILKLALQDSRALEPFTAAMVDLQVLACALSVKTLKDLGENEIAWTVLTRLRGLFAGGDVAADAGGDSSPG